MFLSAVLNAVVEMCRSFLWWWNAAIVAAAFAISAAAFNPSFVYCSWNGVRDVTQQTACGNLTNPCSLSLVFAVAAIKQYQSLGINLLNEDGHSYSVQEDCHLSFTGKSMVMNGTVNTQHHTRPLIDCWTEQSMSIDNTNVSIYDWQFTVTEFSMNEIDFAGTLLNASCGVAITLPLAPNSVRIHRVSVNTVWYPFFIATPSISTVASTAVAMYNASFINTVVAMWVNETVVADPVSPINIVIDASYFRNTPAINPHGPTSILVWLESAAISMAVNNCTFIDTYGSLAMYLSNATADLTVLGCTFYSPNVFPFTFEIFLQSSDDNGSPLPLYGTLKVVDTLFNSTAGSFVIFASIINSLIVFDHCQWITCRPTNDFTTPLIALLPNQVLNAFITLQYCSFQSNGNGQLLAVQTQNITGTLAVSDCSFVENAGSDLIYLYSYVNITAQLSFQRLNATYSGVADLRLVTVLTSSGGKQHANSFIFDSIVAIGLGISIQSSDLFGLPVYLLSSRFTMSSQALSYSVGTWNSAVRIVNCTFDSNGRDTINYGGGLYLNAVSVGYETALVVENTYFISNYARSGAAARLTRLSPVPTKTGPYEFHFYNCTFINNVATNGGAVRVGIVHAIPRTYFRSCLFINNSASYGGSITADESSNVELADVSVSQSIASLMGGAIFSSSDATVLISSSYLTNNRAPLSGGAIFVEQRSAVTLHHSTIELNTATDGGAACVLHSASLTSNGSEWRLNSADALGGAVYTSDLSHLNLFDSKFVSNSGSYGGGLSLRSEYVHIERCLFLKNRATVQLGGGIHVPISVPVIPSTIEIVDTTFDSNTAVSDGGALSLSTIYKLWLNDTWFINNAATQGMGGGVAIHTDAVRLAAGSTMGATNITFQSNSALNGGGIACVSATVFSRTDSCLSYARHFKFFHNSAFLAGGAAYWLRSRPSGRVLPDAIYLNNSCSVAGYGEKLASGPSQLLSDTDDNGDGVPTIFPGRPAQIAFIVKDDFNQTVRAHVDVNLTLCTGQTLVATALNGTALFENVIIVNVTGRCNCTIDTVDATDPIYPRQFEVVIANCPIGFELRDRVGCQSCSADTYSVVPMKPCVRCPDNVDCAAGETPHPEPDYWIWPLNDGRDWSVETVRSQFGDRLRTYACTPNSCSGIHASNVCADYRVPNSTLCGECVEGRSSWHDECVACKSASGGLITMWLLMMWLYVLAQHIVLQHQPVIGPFSIFVFYVQITSFVTYPEPTASIFASFKVWTVIGNMFGDCPFPRSELGVIFTDVVTTLLMFPLLGLSYGIARLLLIRRPAASRKFDLYLRKEAFLRSSVGLVLLTYEPLSEVTYSFFTCLPIGPPEFTQRRFVVSKHPAIQCGDTGWMSSLVLFIPLLAYTLAIPIVLCIILYKARAQRRYSRISKSGDPAITFLEVLIEAVTLPYNDACYFWEVLALLRRIILLTLFGILSSVGQDFFAQRLSYSIAIIAFVTTHLWVRPYNESQLNLLESLSLVTILFDTVVLTSASYGDAEDSDSSALFQCTVVVGLTVAAIIFAVIMLPILRLCYEHFKQPKRAADSPVAEAAAATIDSASAVVADSDIPLSAQQSAPALSGDANSSHNLDGNSKQEYLRLDS